MADDTFTQDQDDTTTTFLRQNHNLLNLTNDTSTGVSPLEQEVLDEYTRLLSNMNQLTKTLTDLSSGPITLDIAEQLRLLERKVASVYTLMKASVYSIVLQQGQVDGTVMEGEGDTGVEGR
ncbi:hypothetical protein OHC33_003159 [Knufia fluminis]|uniref:DASH complex subunit DAD3 n=1 Tax=Knufia fluminis TaxID=191047 RepID=A0AAN8I786_9EURO|nr:hypothetical protein OHC33_003159 [Knufia fluminis]